MGILEYWFENPRVWFKATREDDIFITNNWGKYIDNVNIPKTNRIHECLEFILIHHQVTPHVYRNSIASILFISMNMNMNG